MTRFVGRYADLLLVVIFLAVFVWIMYWQNNRIDAAAASTLAGAFFGGAAVLLGNWINRVNEGHRARDALIERRAKLTTLVTAELADVATGLIAADKVIRVVRWESDTTHSPVTFDLTLHLPRGMPFTFSLGTDILLLSQPAVDGLSILRSNLTATREQMNASVLNTTGSRLLEITSILNSLSHTTEILAQCFEHIAPTRKLKLTDHPPELASQLLRKVSRGESPLIS